MVKTARTFATMGDQPELRRRGRGYQEGLQLQPHARASMQALSPKAVTP